jgi:DNA-binding transcriptional regulator PaaX
MGIYKYYFKKSKSEIAKDVMKLLLISGAMIIAASSPYFIRNVLKYNKNWEKYPKIKIANTFSNLRRRGFINIEKRGNQIYIHLTKEGRKKAGLFQINSLKIKKPKRWDRKWRIAIFDISQLKKLYREALRGKLKELGFYKLQKSIWIHPFDCKDELDLLRDFFGLSEDELRIIIAENIGSDTKLKQYFKLTRL